MKKGESDMKNLLIRNQKDLVRFVLTLIARLACPNDHNQFHLQIRDPHVTYRNGDVVIEKLTDYLNEEVHNYDQGHRSV